MNIKELGQMSLKDMERKIGEMVVEANGEEIVVEIIDKRTVNPSGDLCNLFVWDRVLRLPDGSELRMEDLIRDADIEGIKRREIGMFG